MIVFLVVFVILVSYGSAPYGRHLGSNFTRIPLGPALPAKVAWVLQELPNLVWVVYYLLNADQWTCSSIPNMILLLLFTGHYVNRTLIYPLSVKSKKTFPFLVVFFAFAFTSFNGYAQVASLTHYGPCLANDRLSHPSFIVGVAIFFAGMYTNIKSDSILANLRKPGESSGYKIPRGFAFEYVSAANLFGEILEWVGFAIASWSLSGVTFAFCTFCNLAPRGLDHHKWYKNEFKEKYPKSRKAVIPFIW
jgi:3-oxo-5-alpha-steroid 4-dehydrogenase 1